MLPTVEVAEPCPPRAVGALLDRGHRVSPLSLVGCGRRVVGTPRAVASVRAPSCECLAARDACSRHAVDPVEERVHVAEMLDDRAPQLREFIGREDGEVDVRADLAVEAVGHARHDSVAPRDASGRHERFLSADRTASIPSSVARVVDSLALTTRRFSVAAAASRSASSWSRSRASSSRRVRSRCRRSSCSDSATGVRGVAVRVEPSAHASRVRLVEAQRSATPFDLGDRLLNHWEAERRYRVGEVSLRHTRQASALTDRIGDHRLWRWSARVLLCSHGQHTTTTCCFLSTLEARTLLSSNQATLREREEEGEWREKSSRVVDRVC